MANNKVVFGQEVLIDLTQDTVTPYALEEGYTAHAPSGEKIVGVMKPNKPVEVETNAEMTAISTGATEKDLGKVYLFVGEDDGVFEKDALYILVKKGTGYGFQRYAIGGSGEESTPLQEKTVEITENRTTEVLPDEGYGLSKVIVTTNVAGREDLDAELNEQEALIAELKEKLANGGGNGGTQECDCIIDVTELPTENIDENAVYKVMGEGGAEIWGAFSDGPVAPFAEIVASFIGASPNVTYYVVDTLPDIMIASDMEEFSALHVYILRRTGVGYISEDGTSASAMSVGELLGGSSEIDKGWANDASSIIAPPDGAEFYAILVPASTTYGIPSVENTFVYVHNGSSWDEFTEKEPLLASANFTDYATLAGSEDGITITGLTRTATSLKIQGNVSSIGYAAFAGQTLKSVIIPTSVTSIAEEAFANCLSLTSIVYNGTKAQWKAISKGELWDHGTPDYIVTCTDGTIAKDGTET